MWEVRRALPRLRSSAEYGFEWTLELLLKLINNTFTIPGVLDPFASRGDMGTCVVHENMHVDVRENGRSNSC